MDFDIMSFRTKIVFKGIDSYSLIRENKKQYQKDVYSFTYDDDSSCT